MVLILVLIILVVHDDVIIMMVLMLILMIVMKVPMFVFLPPSGKQSRPAGPVWQEEGVSL